MTEKYFIKALEKLLSPPKCPECGNDMPKYPYYSEMFEYRTCEHCGHTIQTERIKR